MSTEIEQVVKQCATCLELKDIMLCTHQYSVFTLYKPGPELYIVHWLSYHNHAENKGQEMSGMKINMHMINITVDIAICMSIQDIKSSTEEDEELKMLKWYINRGWWHTKEWVEPGLEKYWLMRHGLTIIDSIAMKGIWIIIPYLLQRQILEWVHSNHMGIEKTWLLTRESVY